MVADVTRNRRERQHTCRGAAGCRLSCPVPTILFFLLVFSFWSAEKVQSVITNKKDTQVFLYFLLLRSWSVLIRNRLFFIKIKILETLKESRKGFFFSSCSHLSSGPAHTCFPHCSAFVELKMKYGRTDDDRSEWDGRYIESTVRLGGSRFVHRRRSWNWFFFFYYFDSFELE